MPTLLDLTGSTKTPGQPVKDNASIMFAMHALAVIRVHDEEQAKERGLTLRQIAMQDDYLRERVENLTAQLFFAFGRNCVPIFTGFLEGIDFEEGVTAYTRSLEQQLKL